MMFWRLRVVVFMAVCSLTSAVSAQSVLHIQACADQQGRVRIIPEWESCRKQETPVSWPAETGRSVSYYQRSVSASLVNIPMTVVAFCDALEHTATGGGYLWERHPDTSVFAACWIEANVSCRASKLCSGPAGEDGWAVTAWNCTHPAQAYTLHVFVTCSQP
jgi:hypothetical protein